MKKYQCTLCRKHKPEDEFYKTGKGGYRMSICKTCRNKRNYKRAKQKLSPKKNKFLEFAIQWNKKHPIVPQSESKAYYNHIMKRSNNYESV